MSQYKTCKECGAHLDHGERCGCGDYRRKIDYLLSRVDELQLRKIYEYINRLFIYG